MDRPIHLAGLGITKKDPGQEPSAYVPVWVTQSSLDGIHTLLCFLEGLRRGGTDGEIPGAFELVMFYRTLASCLSEENWKDGCRKGAAAIQKEFDEKTMKPKDPPVT